MRSYLPESFDSDLIDARDYTNAHAAQVMLRARLQVLSRILFGDRLFVSEGWSLDSVAFLLIFLEVIEAIDLLKKECRDLDAYSPFRAEVRSEASQLERYCEYLGRGDCQWSGFKILIADGREREQMLRAKLASLATAEASSDRVRRAFTDVGLPDHVAEAIERFVRYVDDARFAKARRSPSEGIRPGFYHHLREPLDAFRVALHERGEDEHYATLDEFVAKCRRNPAKVATSSGVAQIADDTLPAAMRRAVHHAARGTIGLVTSRRERALVALPAFDRATEPYLALMDSVLQPPAHAASRLEFSGPLNSRDPLLSNLAATKDWAPIWRDAVRLAKNEVWQGHVTSMRDLIANLRAEETIFETKTFRAMEAMIKSQCDQLSLVQTPLQRMGLTVETATPVKNSIEALVGIAASPAVGLVLVASTAGIFNAGLGVAGGLLGYGAQLVAKGALRPSLTSSVLRVFSETR